MENNRAFLRNKNAPLGIKEHFWEVEGHIDLRIRALATSLPSLEWSFLDDSNQNKISNIFLGALFSHGSDILILKFSKIFPEVANKPVAANIVDSRLCAVKSRVILNLLRKLQQMWFNNFMLNLLYNVLCFNNKGILMPGSV